MQHPVVVSVDGSDKDARALAVAASIARLADADLHVIRVVELPSPRLAVQAKAVGVDDAAATGRRDAESQLGNVVAGVTVPDGRRLTFGVVEASDVADAIMACSVQRDARVLVMATRAPSAMDRAIGGSVADRVVRESLRPVVVVPPGAAFMSGKDVQITRVLVPQDGSTLAFRCLEFLIELPRAKELEYVLIEVVASERDRFEVEARQRTTAAWLRARGVKSVELLVVDASAAASAITGAVREVLPDVIAMSTRGSSGLGRLILGSVAEGVVRNSELPILLLTPRMLAQ